MRSGSAMPVSLAISSERRDRRAQVALALSSIREPFQASEYAPP